MQLCEQENQSVLNTCKDLENAEESENNLENQQSDPQGERGKNACEENQQTNEDSDAKVVRVKQDVLAFAFSVQVFNQSRNSKVC